MTESTLDSLTIVAGPVSRETFEDLRSFQDYFLKWNRSINLAAPSTLKDVWTRHILDSAQIFGIRPDARRWLDLGSGGGFPGLIIAFLLRDRGEGAIHLVESNRKKAAFLQAASARYHLPTHVHADRAEHLVGQINMPDVVSARALAPLSLLLKLAEPWLTAGAHGLFHKGRDYRAEIEETHDAWKFDLVEHRSRIDPDGVILEISNLRRTSDGSGQSAARHS